LDESDCDVENNDGGDDSAFDPILYTPGKSASGDENKCKGIGCEISSVYREWVLFINLPI
jgi:hypothetical protein